MSSSGGNLFERVRDRGLKLAVTVEEFIHDTDGATAVEYGMIVAGIATSILAVTFALGDSVAGIFQYLQQEMANTSFGNPG